MSFVRSLRNAVKGAYQRAVVKRHYGVTHPDVVQLPGTTNRIHIDPDDPRAWKILAMAPLFGRIPRNQTFWRQACEQLAPALALDIGLNFGECLFPSTYPPHTQIHAFEANPRLRPYVERSLAEHPAQRQMRLHFGLVSAQPGPDAEFYVDRRWSGGSTAVSGLKPEETDRYDMLRVPVLSVDTSLAATGATKPARSLVFKIDVEGYEYRVLQGMQKTLDAPRWTIGLIEFDTALLKKAGESLTEYFAFLENRFAVYAFHRGSKAARTRSWSELTGLFPRPDFHTDLLLAAGDGEEAVDRFLSEWTISQPSQRRRAA